MNASEQFQKWNSEIDYFCCQIKNYARDHRLDRDHLDKLFGAGIVACVQDGSVPIQTYNGEIPGQTLTPEEEARLFPKATPPPVGVSLWTGI